MFTIISRIVHFGLKNFWRNVWLSTATVAIMTLALIVFIGLILFGYITDSALTSIQNKIDISAYFKTNTPEDEILNIKQSLESLSEVKEVSYISSDEALAIFKQNHANDQTITQAINELDVNPLEASLNIKAQRPDQYATIANYLSAPNLSQYIDSVSYAKNQGVIDRLNHIISSVYRAGLTIIIVLALIAGLVVFNTIALAIYSNRDEIGIMRAVGASNILVRGPYMVEGIIAGLLSAVISLVIMVPVAYFVSPYLSEFIPGLSLFRYFSTHIFQLFLYGILFSVIIALLSSVLAVRRYLKN